MSLFLLLNPKNFLDPGPIIEQIDSLRRKRRQEAALVQEAEEVIQDIEEIVADASPIDQKLQEFEDVQVMAAQLRELMRQRDLDIAAQLEIQGKLAGIEQRRREIAQLILMLEEEEQLLMWLLIN